MPGVKQTVVKLLQIFVITALAKCCLCILPGPQRCTGNSLQVICQCSNGYYDLDLPTFKLANIHHTGITSITVQNCRNVSIGAHAIRDFRSLRDVYIQNVDNLQLKEESFFWPGYSDTELAQAPKISISILNSKIHQVPPFTLKGKLQKLTLESVKIDTVQPFAFSSISQVSLIEIRNCSFGQIQVQAFKKLSCEKFIISRSRFFGILPSRSFAEIDVTNLFKIEGSRFEVVKPGAFVVNQPRVVEILNSHFDEVEDDGFKIRAKGAVIIKNNHFQRLQNRAFNSITLIKDYRLMKEDLIFENNTVSSLKKGAFAFDQSSFNPKFGPILVNQSCTCADVQIWVSNGQWEEQIHCVVDKRQTKAADFKRSQCDSTSANWIVIISVVCAVFIVAVILTVVLVIVYRKYKKAKQKEYVNRGQRKNGSLGLIVPDGRTYKETEVHVIVEKAELLTTEL